MDFSLERYHYYVYSHQEDVTIETDHKPLISISKKALASAPRRLQRLLLRLQRYTFNLVYRPGSELMLAGTLSRAYAPADPTDESTQFTEELATLMTTWQRMRITVCLTRCVLTGHKSGRHCVLSKQRASGTTTATGTKHRSHACCLTGRTRCVLETGQHVAAPRKEGTAAGVTRRRLATHARRYLRGGSGGRRVDEIRASDLSRLDNRG